MTAVLIMLSVVVVALYWLHLRIARLERKDKS